ncbi:MAG: hypothetical protein AAGG81_03745 [Chlamydiota bacterium]
MTVSRLCELADIAAGIGQSQEPEDSITKSQRLLIRRIKLDLMRLRKKDSKIYAKLKIKKSELKNQLDNAENLSKDDWKMLRALRKKTKAMIETLYPTSSDEELIEEQQERHITKRFNVNEKWLPLK